MAVLRKVDRAVEVVVADRGHATHGLVGRDHLGVQADPAGAAGGALELAQLIRARGQPQTARTLEHAESLIIGQTNQLKFVVRDHAGRPVELENFLGTPLHLFIVSQNLSSCLHAHPQAASALGGMVRFAQSFPNPGTYKLFAQFRPKMNHLDANEALLAQFVLVVRP